MIRGIEAFFAWMGDIKVAAVELLLLLMGTLVGWLTHIRRTRLAFLIMIGSAYVVLVAFSLFFDVPDAVTPRTSHLYLLVLMLACVLVLRDEPVWLRLMAPAVAAKITPSLS